MNLAIITQAVLRTVYARVMQVLVQNRNWLAVVAAKNFPSASVQAREVSKASVNAFGAVQKNTFGLDLVLNQIQKLFREKMLQQPNAIVIPHGTMAFLQLCKPENKVSFSIPTITHCAFAATHQPLIFKIYALCGSLAEKLNVASERELMTNIYQNQYSVFEHRPMTVSDNSNEVNSTLSLYDPTLHHPSYPLTHDTFQCSPENAKSVTSSGSSGTLAKSMTTPVRRA